MKKKVLIIVLVVLIIVITTLIGITKMLFDQKQEELKNKQESERIKQQTTLHEINDMDLTISNMTQELLNNIEDKKDFTNSIKEFLYKNNLNSINNIELFQHTINNEKIYMYFKGNSTNKKQNKIDNTNNNVNANNTSTNNVNNDINTSNTNNNSGSNTNSTGSSANLGVTIYLEVEFDKNTKRTSVNFAGD